MLRTAMLALALGAAMPALAQHLKAAPAPKVEEASIADLQHWMASGRASSESLTRAYLARIAAMDRQGPTLRAVIAVNPQALAEARASDARRRAHKLLGPMD